MSQDSDAGYGVAEIRDSQRTAAPDLPYRPAVPKSSCPPIGVIGCGGLSEQHRGAYRAAGFNVIALCDIDRARAEQRQGQFFPNATTYTEHRALLERDDIAVVDITTHPADRVPILHDALEAGKHVLSQKPFVLDLDLGEKLVALADRKGVKLAVNMNGRWAPHFAYMRQAIGQGLIGQVVGAHLSVHWNHNWIAGTDLENVKHIVLFDFGIHWFDIVTCFLGNRSARRVYASTARSAAQQIRPALLGQAVIEYDGAQASLAFDADAKFGPQDRTYIAGTTGTLVSVGPDLQDQQVTLYTSDGHASPPLEGKWFPTGFHGTMAELLCAIEENREPSNSARDNLRSLALCYAAVASAERNEPVVPGTVRRLPGVSD